MNENIEKLLQLIKENPDLPILPMVDGEVCGGDDYNYWMGAWGRCRIDEYLIDEWYGDGCVRFKSDGDEDTIIEGIAEIKYDGTDEDYEKAEKEVASMWKKAIVVYICLPF